MSLNTNNQTTRFEFEENALIKDFSLSSIYEHTRGKNLLYCVHFASSEDKQNFPKIKGSFIDFNLSASNFFISVKNKNKCLFLEFNAQNTPIPPEILNVAEVIIKLHYYFPQLKNTPALMNEILSTINTSSINLINGAGSISDAKKQLFNIVKTINLGTEDSISLNSYKIETFTTPEETPESLAELRDIFGKIPHSTSLPPAILIETSQSEN